jgi:maleylacetate reductase
MRRSCPATIAALRSRRPDEGLGALEALAETLRERAGALLPGDPTILERLVETAAARDELGRVAPAPDRDEIRAIYRAALTPRRR